MQLDMLRKLTSCAAALVKLTALDLGASRHDALNCTAPFEYFSALTRLEELNLSNHLDGTPGSLPDLRQFTRLRTLSLHISRAGVHELRVLEDLPLELIVPLSLNSSPAERAALERRNRVTETGFTESWEEFRAEMRLLPPRVCDALDRGMHVRRAAMQAYRHVGRWPVTPSEVPAVNYDKY